MWFKYALVFVAVAQILLSALNEERTAGFKLIRLVVQLGCLYGLLHYVLEVL